jgi:CelD/BcsL family acetyltransferase involved in cellulose biosynthesis
MFNSFDADAEIAKASPGDLLLQRIIVKACGDGLRRFDLGIGEARYKTALCDEPIALFDAIVPVSVIGAIVARLVSLRQTAKRAIKANPRLYGLARWARTLRV